VSADYILDPYNRHTSPCNLDQQLLLAGCLLERNGFGVLSAQPGHSLVHTPHCLPLAMAASSCKGGIFPTAPRLLSRLVKWAGRTTMCGSLNLVLTAGGALPWSTHWLCCNPDLDLHWS
jgi:hypothetical protein